MAVYRYPPEVHEFVKEWAPKLRDRELAEACNEKLGTSFTASSMKAFRGNHGYKNGMKRYYTKEEYWKHQTHYPQGMYEFIRDNSWGVSSAEMARKVEEKFGVHFTPTNMKQFRQRHKIRSGLTGWFQKNHPPGNKGKKLEEYITDPERLEDIRRRLAPTQFKKGQRPVNELPVGTIVVNSDGYKLIKLRMEGTIWERWEPLHRYVWKEHNGQIPKGMYVTFKDTDRMNCEISNLMLVTKGENAQLTGLNLRFSDPDATMAGLNIIRLKNTLKARKKEKEQDGGNL